jgi:hypothetical protein
MAFTQIYSNGFDDGTWGAMNKVSECRPDQFTLDNVITRTGSGYSAKLFLEAGLQCSLTAKTYMYINATDWIDDANTLHTWRGYSVYVPADFNDDALYRPDPVGAGCPSGSEGTVREIKTFSGYIAEGGVATPCAEGVGGLNINLVIQNGILQWKLLPGRFVSETCVASNGTGIAYLPVTKGAWIDFIIDSLQGYNPGTGYCRIQAQVDGGGYSQVAIANQDIIGPYHLINERFAIGIYPGKCVVAEDVTLYFDNIRIAQSTTKNDQDAFDYVDPSSWTGGTQPDTTPPVISSFSATSGLTEQITVKVDVSDSEDSADLAYTVHEVIPKMLVETLTGNAAFVYNYDSGTPANYTNDPTLDPEYDALAPAPAVTREFGRVTTQGLQADYDVEVTTDGLHIADLAGSGTALRYAQANVGADDDTKEFFILVTVIGTTGTVELGIGGETYINVQHSIGGTSSAFRITSDGVSPNAKIRISGDFDGEVVFWSVDEIVREVSSGTVVQGSEQTLATDTGLSSLDERYYITEITDVSNNRVISSRAYAKTGTSSSQVIKPVLNPTTALFPLGGGTVFVTEDSETESYYVTDGTTPDSGDTLVSNGEINITTDIAVDNLKVISVEANTGAAEDIVLNTDVQSETDTATDTLTFTKPAGLADDDYLLMAVGTNARLDTVTSTGFTEIQALPHSAGNNMLTVLQKKITAIGGEPASYDAVFSSSAGAICGYMWAERGIDLTTFNDQTPETNEETDSDTIAVPSITTVTDKALVVHISKHSGAANIPTSSLVPGSASELAAGLSGTGGRNMLVTRSINTVAGAFTAATHYGADAIAEPLAISIAVRPSIGLTRSDSEVVAGGPYTLATTSIANDDTARVESGSFGPASFDVDLAKRLDGTNYDEVFPVTPTAYQAFIIEDEFTTDEFGTPDFTIDADTPHFFTVDGEAMSTGSAAGPKGRMVLRPQIGFIGTIYFATQAFADESNSEWIGRKFEVYRARRKFR